jgi:MFS transporter, DHA2 family, multidrug resistance protein
LFNLMRNLGGAIGLALIDTVIYGRSAMHGTQIVKMLQAGDINTARFIGLPLEIFAARPAGPIDAGTRAMLQPLIEAAAFTEAINDAWALVAVLTAVALICVPFAKRPVPQEPALASRRPGE